MSAPQQMGRNSRRKTALLRGRRDKLDALDPLISATTETKPLTNCGSQWPWTERGKGGDDTLNGKDADRGISWPSQSPLCLHASTPVFSGETSATHAWMAMGHSHLLTGRTGLLAWSSCTPGVRMAAKEVVVEWQSIGRCRGFRV